MATGEGVEEGGHGGGGGVLGTSAGTIVWVRRRNGSWWPGRILGPEELPTSHLMSPRSGTPVKLLGREDASVDWYNLEKSKRVKAFRCGEFDACIERAEASLGFPIKKREKYARREDAILHALELEKQQKQEMLLNCLSDKSSLALQKDLNNFSSEIYTRNDELGVHIKHTRNKSQTLSGKVALPHEEENAGESLHAHNKNAKQSSWEDVLETIPRMRGLQDFGLRIASSRRRTAPWETSQKLDDIVANYPSDEHLMGGASYAGGNKGLLSIKKKRSYGGMPQESLGKRRDRRRPLNQVLQSSAKLSVTHSLQCDHDAGLIMMEGETDQMDVARRAKKSKSMYLPASSNDSLDCLRYPPGLVPSVENQFGPDSFGDEYTFSGLVESDNSYSSESRYLEPDADEDVNLYTGMKTVKPGSQDAGRHINCGSSPYLIPDELANVDTDEMGLMIPQFPHHVAADTSAEVGVSKWHIKGKRNVRNIAKRPIDAIDGKKALTGVHKSNGFAKAKAYESKRSSFKMEKMSHFCGFYHTEDNSIIDADLAGHSHLTGHGGRRYSSILKAGKCYGRNYSNLHFSNDDSHVLSPSGWEADGPSHMARRSCWLESEECFDPVYSYHLSGEMEPMLVDVDLKVQAATYQGEHVPLVSLMSRLNGKAIVGHPVQIEISEDGSTAQLVSGIDVFPDDSIVSPPVWRTARRTAMQRVPRSNPGSAALDSDDAEQLHFPDTENKTLIKRPYSVRLNHQSRLAKMSHSQTRQSVSGKFQKKLPKREGLSSQKIRTLSSIATDYRLGGENVDVKLSKDGGILSGLIKPEKTVPLVTCVPLKVVFSRILEAVGRPSSAVAHRVRMASSAVRDPS